MPISQIAPGIFIHHFGVPFSEDDEESVGPSLASRPFPAPHPIALAAQQARFPTPVALLPVQQPVAPGAQYTQLPVQPSQLSSPQDVPYQQPASDPTQAQVRASVKRYTQ